VSVRVLVADDDQDNRTILREALQAAGYEVLEASDGEVALAMASKERPGAMILDMSMPRMDGWEVARRLRKLPFLNDMPVIAFTAHALTGDEEKARQAGCDDYLAKPCSPSLVLRKVEAWLQKRGHS
jgi:two-component system, cell cycle response regulator DivK